MGPLIDKPNVERVNKVVEKAINEGAKVIVRGGPILEGDLAKGAFYRPSLLEVTDNSMDIIQKETFGPVLTLQVFDTEAEAIALANDNEYGLAASIGLVMLIVLYELLVKLMPEPFGSMIGRWFMMSSKRVALNSLV